MIDQESNSHRCLIQSKNETCPDNHTNFFSLSLIIVLFVVGCAKEYTTEHIRVSEGSISKLVIKDFNWESQQTLVYQIAENNITVFDEAQPTKILESISLPDGNDVWEKVDAINRIYTQPVVDERIADGTSLTFIFSLADGRVFETYVSNVSIGKYALVTRAVSEHTIHPIHYHQY